MQFRLNNAQTVALMFVCTLVEEDAHTVRAAIATLQEGQQRIRTAGIQLPGQPDPRVQIQAEMEGAMQMLGMALPRLLAKAAELHQIMGTAAPAPGQPPAESPKIAIAE